MDPLPKCTTKNILSLLKLEESMTIDELRNAYKDDFGIDLTLENLNELYGCECKTFPEALKHGLNEYALFVIDKHYGNQVTYLSKNKTNAAQRRRKLYRRVKEAIVTLIEKEEILYKNDLMENIFSSLGVVLNLETLKELYGEGSGYRQIFARGLKKIAFVTVVPLKQGKITFSFECKEKPDRLSLERAFKLKQKVVIHDGCAGSEDPVMEFPELGESLSWHSINHESYRKVAENIASNWNLNWDDVKDVTLCVGGSIHRSAAPETVFENVKEIVVAIMEKAPRSTISLWTLPIHPQASAYTAKAAKLNKFFAKLRAKPTSVSLHDVNREKKDKLKDLESWKGSFTAATLDMRLMKSWLLEFVSNQK